MPPVSDYFTGRETDIHRMMELLGHYRVITLTGLGGIGKSELAKAVADQARGQAWAGSSVRYVDLQNATNSNAVVSALVTGLGLQPVTDVGTLAHQLGGRHLYVLDDCYQALRSDRRGVQELVRVLHDYASPARFLLTSRELVGLPGLEHPYALDKLPSPDDANLFRAVARSVDYVWRAGDEELLAALLRDLDGYPLALVLAGHLLYDSSLEGVLKRWQNRHTAALKVPGTADQDLDRLTSVDFSLALSYDALPAGEARTLFVLFAYLPGGATAETLEAMLGDCADEAVRLLVRRSLVQWRDERYVMLVPVREFATYFLSDACVPFRQKLDTYLLALAEQRCGDDRLWAPRPIEVSRFLLTELPNFHAAMDRAKMRADNHYLANLVNALCWFYLFAPFSVEAKQRLQEGVAAAHDVGDTQRKANCIQSLGTLHLWVDEYEQAQRWYEEALPLYKSIGNQLDEADCIWGLGDVYRSRQQYEQARGFYEEALRCYQSINDLRGEVGCIKCLGDVHFWLHEYEQAQRCYEKALPFFRSIGDQWGEANCMKSLGEVYRDYQRYEEASRWFEKALRLYHGLSDRRGEGSCVKCLGDVHRNCRQYEQAWGQYKEALELFQAIGAPWEVANTFWSMSELHWAEGHPEEAVHWMDKAAQLFEKIGVTLQADRAREQAKVWREEEGTDRGN